MDPHTAMAHRPWECSCQGLSTARPRAMTGRWPRYASVPGGLGAKARFCKAPQHCQATSQTLRRWMPGGTGPGAWHAPASLGPPASLPVRHMQGPHAREGGTVEQSKTAGLRHMDRRACVAGIMCFGHQDLRHQPFVLGSNVAPSRS